jgi:hypothetical protein
MVCREDLLSGHDGVRHRSYVTEAPVRRLIPIVHRRCLRDCFATQADVGTIGTCFYVCHCYQRLNAPEHTSSLDLFALLPRLTRRLALVSAASIDFKDFTSVLRDGLVAHLIPISVFVSNSHDVGSPFSRRCLREVG